MPELGGSTTQSGILYQNSIAALYLGRLCEGAKSPPHKRITEVHCEALTTIDDVVLTYADGHREFIQAKEVLEPGSGPWSELWKDFAHQYKADDFQPVRDRLILYVGENRNEWRSLRGISERSEGNACFEQWFNRLTKEQKRVLERIQRVLRAEDLDEENLRCLFRCIRVHQDGLEDLQLRAYREMPQCNVSSATLFRLLRDHAAEYASRRKPINREDLLDALRTEHNIIFENAPTLPDSRHLNPLSFVPEDRTRLRWFVSSRLKDECMRPEREAAMEAIMATKLVVPWAWEKDGLAGHYPYEETCLYFAERSDGLVLLIDSNVSPLCLKEYAAAINAKKTCYIFIKAEGVLDRTAKQFIDAQRRMGSNPIRFRSLDELISALNQSLQAECIRKFRHYDSTLLVTTIAEARL